MRVIIRIREDLIADKIKNTKVHSDIAVNDEMVSKTTEKKKNVVMGSSYEVKRKKD